MSQQQPMSGRSTATRSGPAAQPEGRPWVGASAAQLAQATLFGLAFGFLLQKGGVAKFDILIGVLLLENFVVLQVMFSAIVVGMLGAFVLERAGLLEPRIKATRYGPNIVGGLLFGVGFALLAYCPGTNAAAVGQGNLDALVGVVGMVVGSYVFALATRRSAASPPSIDRGKLTVGEALGMSRGPSVAILAAALVGTLALLEVLSGR